MMDVKRIVVALAGGVICGSLAANILQHKKIVEKDQVLGKLQYDNFLLKTMCVFMIKTDPEMSDEEKEHHVNEVLDKF